MASPNPSAETTSGPQVNRVRKLKKNITRARSGCHTCRRRRKKCDEKRPTCGNCRKLNHICEGYPQQTIWEPGISKRLPDGASMISAGSSIPHASQSPGLTLNSGQEFGQWYGHDQSQPTSPVFYNASTVPTGAVQQDDLGFMFEQYGDSTVPENGMVLGRPRVNQGPFFDDYANESQDLVLRNGFTEGVQERQSRQNQVMRPFVPVGLPYLIIGVDSAIHRRLFSHFTRSLSHVLTTFPGNSNPFNSVVIPLAMTDKNVLDTVLCLAGSHLLKLSPHTLDNQLRTETARLKEQAIKTQRSRIQELKDTTLTATSGYASSHREAVFATSLLLLLNDICEGTGNGAWLDHLEAARQVITHGSDLVLFHDKPQLIKTDINPFLLEFYQYHDSLAAVTVSLAPVVKPRFSSFTTISDDDSSMVGVQDGLIDFVPRISSLRSEVYSSPNRPDGNLVAKAVIIFEDLASWKPTATLSRERTIINEIYKWALYIWLFSIIYPDQKSHKNVQNAVKKTATDIGEIKPGDGVMACLLFPLFIVGSAAITPEDKDAISAHFQRLRDWSSLGNIDLTYKIVRRMWDDHDLGVEDSWDWVKQMRSHGMSFLVT